jgi:hypothetical protein
VEDTSSAGQAVLEVQEAAPVLEVQEAAPVLEVQEEAPVLEVREEAVLLRHHVVVHHDDDAMHGHDGNEGPSGDKTASYRK